MKRNLMSAWWHRLNSFWISDEVVNSDDIRIPTSEQQERRRLALARLREQARAMKAPYSTEEIVDLIHAGRR